MASHFHRDADDSTVDDFVLSKQPFSPPFSNFETMREVRAVFDVPGVTVAVSVQKIPDKRTRGRDIAASCRRIR